jgi:two-component system, OmpR family, sensor kinase
VSFRTRLVLAAAYLVAAVVLALEIPLALSIERRADSDFQADVLGRTALLAARISDDVAAVNQGSPNASTAALTQSVDTNVAAVGERIVVTNARGRVLADSSGAAASGSSFATTERPEFAVALEEGRVDSRRRFSETAGEELLLVTVPVVDGGEVVGAVRVSASRESVVDRVHSSWLRLAAIGLAVVAGAFVLAWILATTVSRPLRRLRDTAGQLGGGDLDARAATEGPSELAALGVSFNRMADALGSSMRAQRDFVANASHQLRTPLTGVKLRLEAIRAEGGPAGENAAKAEEELDRLEALVDDLLALAGAATALPTGTTVDLSSVIENAAERWQAPASEAEKTVEVGRHESAFVFADPDDLAHVVDNLVENALRYTPVGARVTIESLADDGRATLAVADDGPGIPAEDRERVFERFYRGANGRRLGPGTGLGLAIVAELAGRWGGQVTLADGPGTRIQVAFRHTPADR